jgi:hypothetical protein
LGKLSRKLEERSAAFDRMAGSLDEVGFAAQSSPATTLPRFAPGRAAQRDTRALDRVLNALGENPQSFVSGAQRGKLRAGRVRVQERIPLDDAASRSGIAILALGLLRGLQHLQHFSTRRSRSTTSDLRRRGSLRRACAGRC